MQYQLQPVQQIDVLRGLISAGKLENHIHIHTELKVMKMDYERVDIIILRKCIAVECLC